MENYGKGEEAYSRLKEHVKACDDKHRHVIDNIMSLQTEVTKLKERQNNFGHQLNDIKVSIDELGSKQDTLTRRRMGSIVFGNEIARSTGVAPLGDTDVLVGMWARVS